MQFWHIFLLALKLTIFPYVHQLHLFVYFRLYWYVVTWDFLSRNTNFCLASGTMGYWTILLNFILLIQYRFFGCYIAPEYIRILQLWKCNDRIHSNQINNEKISWIVSNTCQKGHVQGKFLFALAKEATWNRKMTTLTGGKPSYCFHNFKKITMMEEYLRQLMSWKNPYCKKKIPWESLQNL